MAGSERVSARPEEGDPDCFRTSGSRRPMPARRWLALAVTALLAASGAAAVARPGNLAPPAVQVATMGGGAPLSTLPVPPSTTTTVTTAAATTAPAAPTPTTPRRTSAPKAPNPTPPVAGVPGTYPLAGARSPGTVVVPYEAGRTTWAGVSNGVAVRVTMDPPAPRVGDVVRFRMEATAGDLACCGLFILYGDGGRSAPAVEWPNDGGCAGAVPGTASADDTHVYNRAGRWEFSFQATTGRCGTDNTYGNVHGFVAIAPGVPAPQGPAQPKVIVAEARAPGQAVVAGALEVHAMGTDDDGYVARLVIDFGDGSTPQSRPGDPAGCRPSSSGWPAPSEGRTMAPYPSHQYATAGSYIITATVISAGCDGTGEQTVSASMTFAW